MQANFSTGQPLLPEHVSGRDPDAFSHFLQIFDSLPRLRRVGPCRLDERSEVVRLFREARRRAAASPADIVELVAKWAPLMAESPKRRTLAECEFYGIVEWGCTHHYELALAFAARILGEVRR